MPHSKLFFFSTSDVNSRCFNENYLNHFYLHKNESVTIIKKSISNLNQENVNHINSSNMIVFTLQVQVILFTIHLYTLLTTFNL